MAPRSRLRIGDRSDRETTSRIADSTAMNSAVSGYVNGATSDFVYYRLVKKD